MSYKNSGPLQTVSRTVKQTHVISNVDMWCFLNDLHNHKNWWRYRMDFLQKLRTGRPIQLPPIAFTVRIIDYYDHVPRPTHATLISCALSVDLLFAIRQIVHQPCISYKSPFHAAGHLSNECHVIYIGTLHFSTESTNYYMIVNNIWTDTGLFVSRFRWGSFVDISLQKPW